MPEKLLTTEEACAKLGGVEPWAIRCLAGQKRIPHTMVGQLMLFPESQLNEWIKAQDARPGERLGREPNRVSSVGCREGDHRMDSVAQCPYAERAQPAALFGGAPLGDVPAPSSAPGWLTMAESAKRMGYSYFWLARNWKRLGLRPTNFGHRRMFEEEGIEECMRRNRFSHRGRPPKGRDSLS
jgi:excisionase family DNA binding protein